jgi:hypothetical protein
MVKQFPSFMLAELLKRKFRYTYLLYLTRAREHTHSQNNNKRAIYFSRYEVQGTYKYFFFNLSIDLDDS